MIVPCDCGAKLKIDDDKIGDREVRLRCPRCGNILSVRRPEPKPIEVEISADTGAEPSSTGSNGALVLIAHDSDMVREMVGGVLLDAGFTVEHAADGVEALEKAGLKLPQAMIIDVGLPGIYGFELCERIKSDDRTRGIKIILLASVYGVTRYKRMPTSLYGADDYIEKHHIADTLVHKLSKLIAPAEERQAEEATQPAAQEHLPGPAPAHTHQAPAQEPGFFSPESLVAEGHGAGGSPAVSVGAAGEAASSTAADAPELSPESFSLDSSIFEKEECDIPRVEESDPEAIEKAKRFARIIVSDIALYNQEAVIEGVKNGTFYDLLREDIDEGRRLYDTRVPDAIRSQRDYYMETVENFIENQKKIAH